MSDELKPCPFCGGPAQRFTIGEEEPDNAGGDVISCTRCGASSHVEFGRKENLVDLWNTRADEADREAVLEEAVKQALLQVEKYAEFFCEEDFDPLVDQLRTALKATPAPEPTPEEVLHKAWVDTSTSSDYFNKLKPASDIAIKICGCSNRDQHRRDVAIIEADRLAVAEKVREAILGVAEIETDYSTVTPFLHRGRFTQAIRALDLSAIIGGDNGTA